MSGIGAIRTPIVPTLSGVVAVARRDATRVVRSVSQDEFQRVTPRQRLRPVPTAVEQRLQALSQGSTVQVAPLAVVSHMGSEYSKRAARNVVGQLPNQAPDAQTDAAAAAAIADITGYSSHEPWLGFTTAVATGVVTEVIEADGPLPERLHDLKQGLPAHLIGAAAGTGSAFLGHH